MPIAAPTKTIETSKRNALPVGPARSPIEVNAAKDIEASVTEPSRSRMKQVPALNVIK